MAELYTKAETAREVDLAAEVSITMVKRAGKETYQREIQASGTAALINGLAVLIKECAAMLNMTMTEVLAVLATVLVAPSAGEKEEP